MSPVRILLLAVTLAIASQASAQQVNPYEAVEFTVPRAAAGAALVVGGLRVPAGSPSPVPAVLIVNTTPGFDGRSESYAQDLNAAGLATLEVDFFQGRGAQASPRQHLPQVYESLRWLAARPGIAADRVGVMGFSAGGAIALLAASQPLARAHAAGKARFAAHLALYPVCWRHDASATGGPGAWPGLRGAYREWTGRPVHILSGGRDDYDGNQGCRPFFGPWRDRDRRRRRASGPAVPRLRGGVLPAAPAGAVMLRSQPPYAVVQTILPARCILRLLNQGPP